MTSGNDTSTPARNTAETATCARLLRAMVSGTVPPRREDVAAWYASAQHVIVLCLHESHVEQVVQADAGVADDTNQQHAA